MELDLIDMDFFYPIGGTGRNVIIFGVDMSSSTKIDNQKGLLILGKGLAQGLEHTLFAEKCIQLILLKITENFVWDYIIMKQTVIHLLMVEKFINLKQKILKL